jgi:uncharacterized glyoxalase superfamily protein PhnB
MELTGLIPMLETNDLRGTIDYYTGTLGFTLDATWPLQGPPTWCRLVAGEVVLMFMTPDEERAPTPPQITGQLYCYPPDVDALWQQLRHRTEVVSPLADWDHGMREFQIRDCNGYVLRFGQEIARDGDRS